MRIGAVIETGGGESRQRECDHRGCGRGGQQEDCRQHPSPSSHQHQQQHDERPEQVELLLDGERPEVAEQLRSGGVEVAGLGGDREPVVGESRGAENLAPDADEHIAANRERRCTGGEDYQGEGGEKPARPPGPEGAKSDGTRGGVLSQQQRGDEEAADDEEQVDPEVATGQDAWGEMEEDDDGDRDCPQAIEAAEPRGGGVGRRCHGNRLPA